MLDLAALEFVVADDGGKDGKTRGVRTRPAIGPLFVRTEIKDGRLLRSVTGVCLREAIELVKLPIHGIHDNSMPVSVERRLAALNIFEGQQPSGGSAFESGRPAFDKRVDRYRIRAGVGFAGV